MQNISHVDFFYQPAIRSSKKRQGCVLFQPKVILRICAVISNEILITFCRPTVSVRNFSRDYKLLGCMKWMANFCHKNLFIFYWLFAYDFLILTSYA